MGFRGVPGDFRRFQRVSKEISRMIYMSFKAYQDFPWGFRRILEEFPQDLEGDSWSFQSSLRGFPRNFLVFRDVSGDYGFGSRV